MTTPSLFPNCLSLSCHPGQHSTFYMWSHGGNCPRKPGSNYTWLLTICLGHRKHAESLHCLFILSNLFLTNDRLGLLRKTDMPYNKSDLKHSDYLLKAVQATSSSFRKLNPNQNFTGQLQEELVTVFSSLISTSCVHIYITGVYWDVGIIAWWALESDRFGTKFLSLIIRETQSMQFNVYTTHQKKIMVTAQPILRVDMQTEWDWWRT